MLGPVEASLGDHLLDIAAPQMLAVLAILATEDGRALTTAQLVERIWFGEAPMSAVNVLRNHISALRREFDAYGGEGAGFIWLESTRGGYRLCLPVKFDVMEVEALIAAAGADRRSGAADRAETKLATAWSLWRGDPFVGLPGPWAEQQRKRMARLRSELGEATILGALELGRYSAAIMESQALIAADPHSERWHELLMVALSRGGRRVEALDAYRTAHRMLGDELGLRPGPEIARLHQQLLSAEPPRFAATKLPPDLADFVGRGHLVHELTEVLGAEAEHRPVVAITGMGGIGKSAFAMHLAHHLRTHYPDGSVYLDLGGLDEQPPSADTLLTIALRKLGVEPGELPSDTSGRTALWRNTVSDKRILLILDNARDIDQLTPLLPGPGAAAVLVTSRSSLAELFGARLVPLGVLTTDEAWTLLQRLVTAGRLSDEPGAAREILHACGNLPVALRIVGARLATRPGWQLASVAERLADEHQRLAELTLGNTSVESVFWGSYRQLVPDLARAFVLLAFADAPELSIAAVAALLDRDQAEAEQLCEALVDLGMLQTPTLGAYRQHVLLRLFARKVADAVQRRESSRALHRLRDFYASAGARCTGERDGTEALGATLLLTERRAL
ncbi:BTAD domain-containing putative transcriptional regulator [Nocardia sp. NPDC051756]|uniref:AfsR/SARP family transcriptional regulator n=1 Tax=Nocardia sp. NPDC051756 TaxID=3154751 RepID=UPI003444CF98